MVLLSALGGRVASLAKMAIAPLATLDYVRE